MQLLVLLVEFVANESLNLYVVFVLLKLGVRVGFVEVFPLRQRLVVVVVEANLVDKLVANALSNWKKNVVGLFGLCAARAQARRCDRVC